MKYIILLAFIGVMSCSVTSTEIPADFDPEYSF